MLAIPNLFPIVNPLISGPKSPATSYGGGYSDLMTPEQTELLRLRRQVEDLQRALCTLIAWMAQSANSPIRIDEAEQLLEIANAHNERVH